MDNEMFNLSEQTSLKTWRTDIDGCLMAPNSGLSLVCVCREVTGEFNIFKRHRLTEKYYHRDPKCPCAARDGLAAMLEGHMR